MGDVEQRKTFKEWVSEHIGLVAILALLLYAGILYPHIVICEWVKDVATSKSGVDKIRMVELLVKLGDEMSKEGDFGGATKAYVQAQNLAPSPDVEYKLVKMRLQTLAENPDLIDQRALDDLDFSRRWMITLDRERESGVAIAISAHLSLLRGDVEAAELLFKRASDLDGGQGIGKIGLGLIALRRNDIKKAREEFAAAAAALPKSAFAQMTYADLIAEEDPQKAETSYVASLKVRETANAHRGLAKIYMKRNDLQAAAAELQKAVSLDPKDTDSMINLGRILASVGALDDAVRTIRSALAIRPDVGGAELLTSILLNQGRFQEVIDVGQPYLERNVQSLALCMNVARAHDRNGQARAAIDLYRACREGVERVKAQLDPATVQGVTAEIEAALKNLGAEPVPDVQKK